MVAVQFMNKNMHVFWGDGWWAVGGGLLLELTVKQGHLMANKRPHPNDLPPFHGQHEKMTFSY